MLGEPFKHLQFDKVNDLELRNVRSSQQVLAPRPVSYERQCEGADGEAFGDYEQWVVPAVGRTGHAGEKFLGLA